MNLQGIHHLTAISARIRENYRFYTRTLGLRLVKRSVNQDDVSAYHLFYADAKGAPGTNLTFFDWPVPPEQRGTRSITRTALRVAGREALSWWGEHLNEAGVATGPLVERDGRLALDFEDPEGQRLTLIDDGGSGEAHPWERSPVPAAYQIRGLGPITMSVARPAAHRCGAATGAEHASRAPLRAPGESAAHGPCLCYGAGGPGAELH
ncbi:MAG: VOC family protein, partial [Chloroflexaceae bacterium]